MHVMSVWEATTAPSAPPNAQEALVPHVTLQGGVAMATVAQGVVSAFTATLASAVQESALVVR